MKFKRICSLLLALALLASASAAMAAEVTASVLPAAMISAGEGKITITLTNTNEPPEDGGDPVKVSDVYITSPNYPDIVFDAGGSIAPGESKAYSASYFFTEDMFDTSMPFSVSWLEGGETKSKDVSVKVQSTKASAVTVTRVASTKQASPGEEITLTYTVANTSDHAVTVTSVVDREIGGKETIQPKFTLEAGGYLEIPYVYKMGKNTVASVPVVTYKDSLSGETLTATASEITLGMVSSKVSVEVIQGEATANGVLFTLNLTNNGNQKVSDIKITDDQGNRVNEASFALAVGESRQLTYTVLTDTERYVVFNIAGVTSSNDKYEDKTKSYVVRKYIDPSLLGIEFAATVTETLNTAGSIGVRFDINNTGTLSMTNLVISEQTIEINEEGVEQPKLTELYRTDTIAPGPFSATQSVYVGEPRDLTFVVSMNDPAGNPYVYTAYVTADVLGVRDAVDTETAQQTAISTLGVNVGVTVNRALTIALIVLAALVVISIVTMAALSNLEKKQRREAARRRAAKERNLRRAQQGEAPRRRE